MIKCETLGKYWHLKLFWWDLLCNLILHFLGRTSKKTPSIFKLWLQVPSFLRKSYSPVWVLFPTLGRRPTGFLRDKCLKAWVRILALTNFLPGYLSVHQRCVCTHVCIFLFLHFCVFSVLLISFQNTVCFNISLTIPHVCVPLSFQYVCVPVSLKAVCFNNSLTIPPCVFLFLYKPCVFLFVY